MFARKVELRNFSLEWFLLLQSRQQRVSQGLQTFPNGDLIHSQVAASDFVLDWNGLKRRFCLSCMLRQCLLAQSQLEMHRTMPRRQQLLLHKKLKLVFIARWMEKTRTLAWAATVQKAEKKREKLMQKYSHDKLNRRCLVWMLREN